MKGAILVEMSVNPWIFSASCFPGRDFACAWFQCTSRDALSHPKEGTGWDSSLQFREATEFRS